MAWKSGDPRMSAAVLPVAEGLWLHDIATMAARAKIRNGRNFFIMLNVFSFLIITQAYVP
jgi:hypothetical protein